MKTLNVVDERFSGKTIGQIVAQNYRTADVFRSHGIDFCCGGEVTIEEACDEHEVEADELFEELAKIVESDSTDGEQYDKWKLDFLADYIVQQHHNYMREALPEIDEYLQRVCQVHGIQHPELKQIHWYFNQLNDEFTLHMSFEEEKVFPLIKALLNSNRESKDGEVRDTKKGLEVMDHDHDKTGKLVAKIRSLSKDYTPPEDACNTYTILFKKLEELEADIKKHVHLENNILTPKAMRLVS